MVSRFSSQPMQVCYCPSFIWKQHPKAVPSPDSSSYAQEQMTERGTTPRINQQIKMFPLLVVNSLLYGFMCPVECPKWIIQRIMVVQGLIYQGYLQATLITHWNLYKALQLFPLTILINIIAFLGVCSLPICPHSHGRQGNATYPFSSIGTHDLRDTMIKDPYRQPITDREATLNIMNYAAEPIGYSIGHFQSLNQSVNPTQQYQQQEFVNQTSPPPHIYQHQSRQQEIFKSRLGKNSNSRLQPKSKNRAHREIPGIKDMDAKTPKIHRWCSLCDVTYSTKEVLHEQHVFGKKHQCRLKKLKEMGSEDVVKPEKKQPQGLVGWCSLCEVNCESLENIHELHMSGKKHLCMLGMAKTKEQETTETGKDNVLGKIKDDSVKEERDMPSKKCHKLHKGDVAHSQLTKDGSSEAHYRSMVRQKVLLVAMLRKKLLSKLKMKVPTECSKISTCSA